MFLLIKSFIVSCLIGLALGECWWTGCQLSSWAVRGCDQYDMNTVSSESCDGGDKYHCCSKEASSGANNNNGGNNVDSFLPSWEEFKKATTYNSYPEPKRIQYDHFKKEAHRGRFISKEEVAMALAQFIHESDGLRAKREYNCIDKECDYKTPGCDQPGQQYYGRGYIQLTWCGWNYRPASLDIYGDERLVNDPDLVARDESAAWATAFWFWGKNVHDAPGVQQGRFGASTRAINPAIECSGSPHPGPAKRFGIYGNVRKAFGLPGLGDSAGC